MGSSVMLILYEDCVRVLENWGQWSRAGKARLGFKGKTNFYNVGGGPAVSDEDLAQLAELSMCAMSAENPHNRKHVSLLRLKYFNLFSDREIVRRTGQTLRQVQIGRECAHQVFYDYLCRINAQR